MEKIDRFKAYSAMADTSRKWVSVLDSKAGFLSALCAATLAFVWTGAKLADTHGCVRQLTIVASIMLFISLFLTLKVVLPKISLRQAFGHELTYSMSYHPISFFSYVAEKFPSEKHTQFMIMVDAMDEEMFAREALEQHYTICHVLQKKSRDVAWAGWIWLVASTIIIFALALRG